MKGAQVTFEYLGLLCIGGPIDKNKPSFSVLKSAIAKAFNEKNNGKAWRGGQCSPHYPGVFAKLTNSPWDHNDKWQGGCITWFKSQGIHRAWKAAPWIHWYLGVWRATWQRLCCSDSAKSQINVQRPDLVKWNLHYYANLPFETSEDCWGQDYWPDIP